MPQVFYERKDANNYSLGGVRLWVNELKDASVSPPKYGGFIDLGCVEEAPIAQDIQYQEHFCAASGTRIKDRKIVKQVSATITATLIEADAENLRLFFLGGDISDVVAGTQAVANEVMQLTGTERRILKFGRNPVTLIVVEPYGGGAPYVLNTDYEVVSYSGYSAIRRIPGGAILDGDFVEVDYTGTRLASKNFNPVTNILKTCQVLFTGASDTGNEIIAQFDNCNITPNGDFNWNSDDFTKFQILIDILDDSTANPSAPFGVIRNYGVGANL